MEKGGDYLRCKDVLKVVSVLGCRRATQAKNYGDRMAKKQTAKFSKTKR